MDSAPCVFLGIKVKPGPIERFKLENFALDNTVDRLKSEAEKKSNVPSSSLGEFPRSSLILKIIIDIFTFEDRWYSSLINIFTNLSYE